MILLWGGHPARPGERQGYFIVVTEKLEAMKSCTPLTNPRTQDRGAEIFSCEHELALVGRGALVLPTPQELYLPNWDALA